MLKNVPNQYIGFAAIVRGDGTDGTGITPTVTIRKGASAPVAVTNTPAEDAAGAFSLLLSQEETNHDSIVLIFKEATLITQIITIYPKDPALFKADVSGLSTFDPATDAVANVTTVGSVTSPVTTDTASRDASKADVSGLATQASLDTVPKKGTSHRYTNNGGGAGYDDVTITDAP